MSLDVYLVAPGEAPAYRGDRIYVRRDGQTVEVTRAECEPVALLPTDDFPSYVYEANITHNMGRMAAQCGRLYEALWRPDEQGWTRAGDLTGPLRDGLTILQSDYDRLQEFNPENGWGNYDLLVRFTAGYLAACEQWPAAEVQVSR